MSEEVGGGGEAEGEVEKDEDGRCREAEGKEEKDGAGQEKDE
jgi:hypothetical protein